MLSNMVISRVRLTDLGYSQYLPELKEEKHTIYVRIALITQLCPIWNQGVDVISAQTNLAVILP